MQLAPADTSLSFEVTFDRDDLHVGMLVYDDSGLSPVLVSGPITMSHVFNNTYSGKFIGQAGKSYVIIKAVYTDSGLNTLDNNYSQGSESIKCEDINGGSSACGEIIGLIESNNTIIGLIEC